MEYGVSSAAALSASKKLPNGLGCRFSGKSAYAGVFSKPVKFKSSALPSRVEDYSEIFGVSEAARCLSIPTLDFEEINERGTEFRHSSSKVDYSKVFGGLGDVDTAASYTELLDQPKRKTSLPKQESALAKRRTSSKVEDVSIHVSNDPVVFHEASRQFDGPKKISVSYNKINQGDRNGARSTTHISQLHAIPVYTCLVDEISSLKVNRANGYERSVPDVTHSGNNHIEILQEREACTISNTIPQADVNTQCPTSSMKSDRCLSDLNTQTCDEHASENGTRQMKMSPPETLAHDSGNHTNNFNRMENKSQVSNSDASERGNGTYSPPELAEFMDFNSEAAVSVAALKKAIEEAQEKFKLAKESTWRRKEGSKDRVKIKSDDELRRGENVGSVANRINRNKEMKPQMIPEEMRDSEKILSEIEKQMATAGGVAAHLIDRKIHSVAEEAVTETMKESKTTHWESKLEDMGLKEEDIFYEFAHTVRSDESESESEQFYEFVDRGKSEEAKLNSEQVADKEIQAYAIDECGENEERKRGNDFNWLEECRKTVKVVDKELRQDKTGNDVDPGNGQRELENFKHEFGPVQVMQNHVGNENRVNFPDKRNGLEKTLDLLHEHEGHESTVTKFLKPTEKNCISQFQEENEKSVEVSLAEQCERDLRVHGKSVSNEKIPAQVLKEDEEISPGGLKEPQERIDDDILPEPHELQLNLDRQIESQDQIKHGGEASILDKNEEDQECTCKVEDIVKSIDNVYEQKIVETIHHIRANKEDERRHGGGGDLGENKLVVEDKNDEDVLNAVTAGMKENNREWKMASECVAAGRNCTSTFERDMDEYINMVEDVSKHENYNDERSQLNETEIENGEIESTIFSQKEENLVNMELSDELRDVLQGTSESFQSKQNCERSETVQRRNNFVDAVLAETAEKTTNMPAEQNDEECVDAADTGRNLGEIDEVTPNVVNFSNSVHQDDVSVLENVEESCGTFSSERMAGNGNYVEVATTESPTLSEQEPDTNDLRETETSKNGEDVKQNDQTTVRIVEKKNNGANDNLRKVDLEKECLRKTEEAREREKEKERLAVERAIREARERAFADARERAERAALDRATSKARHRMMTETREKLGKNFSQANDKSFAEKAALEAKLKAERAAVERATAEARARALERAMSEKALSEERNKDAQHSTSWSSSTFRYSRSSNYGATHSSGDLGGYYGESAQRCKARSERHQRVMERAAKALAEKSMRDHLAQKEQEERNRLAEALDADIKRWSSGKEGNLRALLSTLHYILGPTSGWQPIPLTDMVTATAVKKAYRKATLCVHPDKLQQRGANIQQKYTCEKVFDLLKEAWNRLNLEER